MDPSRKERLREILLSGEKSASAAYASQSRLDNSRKERIREIIGNENGEFQRKENTDVPENIKFASEVNPNTLLAESLLKGVISIADLPQVLSGLAGLGVGLVSPTAGEAMQPGKLASEHIQDFIKQRGLDLNTQVPQSSEQRVLSNIGEFAGSVAGGGVFGKGAKAVSAVSKTPEIISKPLAAVGEFLGGPAGSSQTPIRDLAKQTAVGATVGGVSGLAQEAGIDPLTANLGASVLVPSMIGAAKQVGKAPIVAGKYLFKPEYAEQLASKAGEKLGGQKFREIIGEKNVPQVIKNLEDYQSPIGYKGTTAEIADNIGLSQLQRAKQGSISEIAERQAEDSQAIRNAFENLAPGESNIKALQQHLGETYAKQQSDLQNALAEISDVSLPGETGESVRKVVGGNLESALKTRRDITKPLYDKVKELDVQVPTTLVDKFLDEELKTAKDIDKAALLRVKEIIKANALKGKDKDSQKLLSSLEKEYPNLGESAKKQVQEDILGQELYPSPAELLAARKALTGRAKTARVAGEDNAKRIYIQSKKLIDKDLENLPEAKKANAAYAELSEPIKEIKKHDILGQIVKKEPYGKDYAYNSEQIESDFINKALRNKQFSQDLKKQIGNNQEASMRTEQYINGLLMKTIANSEGKVNPESLAKWKLNHPGAFEVYKNLDKKLENVQNAQVAINKMRKQNAQFESNEYKGAFASIVGEDPDKVVRSIFTGKNVPEKLEYILENAKADETGAALEGFKRGIVDDLTKSIQNSGLDAKGFDTISYDKFRRYMINNKKYLNKVFDEDQIKVLESVEDSLKRRQKVATVGKAVGSDTAPNLTILSAIQDLPSRVATQWIRKIPGIKGSFEALKDTYTNAKVNARNNIINRALIDPDYAKFLLSQPYKNPKLTSRLLNQLEKKSFLIAPSLVTGTKKESND